MSSGRLTERHPSLQRESRKDGLLSEQTRLSMFLRLINEFKNLRLVNLVNLSIALIIMPMTFSFDEDG